MPQRVQVDERSLGEVLIARRWAEYLVAILTGNILYMYVEPQLPTGMRHRMFRVDWGLALDCLICVAVYTVAGAAVPPAPGKRRKARLRLRLQFQRREEWWRRQAFNASEAQGSRVGGDVVRRREPGLTK